MLDRAAAVLEKKKWLIRLELPNHYLEVYWHTYDLFVVATPRLEFHRF